MAEMIKSGYAAVTQCKMKRYDQNTFEIEEE